jgi:hypothetical protein
MKLNFQPRYFIATLLLGVALLALVAIGIEIGWGRRISLPLPEVKRQENKLALAPLLPEFGLPPLDPSYHAVLERPLFVPTRRPPPPPPPPAPVKPAMKKGQFLLVGAIITKERKIAILREVANGKVARVEEGKEINGIKLEKLEPEKATLTQWDDREDIIMKIQPMPKVLPQTAQVPPPMVPGQPPPPVPGTPPGAQANPPPVDIVAQRRALRGLPPN